MRLSHRVQVSLGTDKRNLDKTPDRRFYSRTRDSTPCRVGRSNGWLVARSFRNIFEFRAVFALLPLPNRPRLDCRVSGLVFLIFLITLITVATVS